MINISLKEKFIDESVMAINNSGEAGTNCHFKKRRVEEDLKRLRSHEQFLEQEQKRMHNWFATRPVRDYLEHIRKALGSIKVAITLLEQWQGIVEMELAVAQKALDACDVYNGDIKDMPERKRKRDKSPEEEDDHFSGK